MKNFGQIIGTKATVILIIIEIVIIIKLTTIQNMYSKTCVTYTKKQFKSCAI